MNIKYKKHLNVGFLFILLVVILFVNFFHSEKDLKNNKFCPVCHFQNSFFVTCHINFFHLPPPSILGILGPSESFNFTYVLSVHPSTRSPPQA